MNQAHLERGRQRGHWAGLCAPPVCWRCQGLMEPMSPDGCLLLSRVWQLHRRSGGTSGQMSCICHESQWSNWGKPTHTVRQKERSFLMENYYLVTVTSFQQYFDGEQCRLMVCSLYLEGFWWWRWRSFYTAADLLVVEARKQCSSHLYFQNKSIVVIRNGLQY